MDNQEKREWTLDEVRGEDRDCQSGEGKCVRMREQVEKRKCRDGCVERDEQKNRGVSGSLLTRTSFHTLSHTHIHRHTPSYLFTGSLDIEMIPWEINHISICW